MISWAAITAVPETGLAILATVTTGGVTGCSVVQSAATVQVGASSSPLGTTVLATVAPASMSTLTWYLIVCVPTIAPCINSQVTTCPATLQLAFAGTLPATPKVPGTRVRPAPRVSVKVTSPRVGASATVTVSE